MSLICAWAEASFANRLTSHCYIFIQSSPYNNVKYISEWSQLGQRVT